MMIDFIIIIMYFLLLLYYVCDVIIIILFHYLLLLLLLPPLPLALVFRRPLSVNGTMCACSCKQQQNCCFRCKMSNVRRRPSSATRYNGRGRTGVLREGTSRRPQSAHATSRRSAPSGVRTKHKIDRLQNMLEKSRKSFGGGSRAVHGIAQNNRNHRVAKLRKDIKMVESYVLHGSNNGTTGGLRDAEDRLRFEKHSYLYRNGEGDRGSQLQAESKYSANKLSSNNNTFLSPWDDGSKDNLDETGMLHIPTTSAMWQPDTGSRAFPEMSRAGKNAYNNESLSPSNHDEAKEEDITAFNAELENRNFHREVNRKNFKVMKSNAPPSSVPISSFCREEGTKHYLMKAKASNSAPRYPNTIVKSHHTNKTNRTNATNGNYDNSNVESALTSTYDTKSDESWNSYEKTMLTKNYGVNGGNNGAKTIKIMAVFGAGKAKSAKMIEGSQRNQNMYGSKTAHKVTYDASAGVYSTTAVRKWKTRPMSASLRRHKIVGKQASERFRSNVDSKFSISINGNKSGIFNTSGPHMKINNKFQSRSRPKSASRSIRRMRRANTSIGENAPGPNFGKQSVRGKHRRPQSAGVRRRIPNEKNLSLFVVSSKMQYQS